MKVILYIVTSSTTILCYASDETSWMLFGAKKLVQYWGISGDSDEIILSQWVYLALEDLFLSLEHMKLGIELVWYVHFRPWML